MFRDHYRDAHQGDTEQIGQYECGSSIGTGQVGELPDVAQADRRADGRRESAERGSECVAALWAGKTHTDSFSAQHTKKERRMASRGRALRPAEARFMAARGPRSRGRKALSPAWRELGI